MNTYVMLIMLLQLDMGGYPYITTMQEDPMREYATLQQCEAASDTKRASMLKTSLKYPDLGIQDVVIRCVDSHLMEDGTAPI